jgi:protein phosphatase PTC7
MMFSTAKALAELARKHSVDVKFDSPYSMEARSRVRFNTKHLLLCSHLHVIVYVISDGTCFTLDTYMQGVDVPWWKKLLGAKLIGMDNLFRRCHALYCT